MSASSKQTLGFQAEVSQILNLMINSLYSNKEIFLRELISNASDALDKLHFYNLQNSTNFPITEDLAITVDFNDKDNTITISDNGIGMDQEEIIQNLGTIAKSGTKEFLAAQLTGDKVKDSDLIGQFGVGFYSAFIVADQVTVVSRRADAAADAAVLWESAGTGEFSVATTTKSSVGTTVTLHLKAAESEFANAWRLRNIIKKYSDHIGFPIKMPHLPDPEDKKNAAQSTELETVNAATALWLCNKSEVKPEEYTEFYKHLTHDFKDPLTHAHNRVEGKLEYTSLLFIPEHAPFDLWNREHKYGLKLYVKRVFIMDNAEQFLPAYLRFVKGVIDSNDLDLNVSREILQHNKVVENIKSALVKRTFTMLENLAQDTTKYKTFWQEFGNVLKEGPAEDYENRERVAKLLRFASTHTGDAAQVVTLDEYISRMQAEQAHIYYLTADSYLAAKNSPYLEKLKEKNIEVLLMYDRVDDWLMSHLNEYSGKHFKSVAKGELDLGKLADENDKEQQQQINETNQDFIGRVKAVLGDKVKDVRMSNRLKNSPACIVVDEHDMGLQMQRLMQAAGHAMPSTKPIFELNPDHSLVNKLKTENNQQKFNEWMTILFEESMLAESGRLEDPAGFVQRLNNMLLELYQ